MKVFKNPIFMFILGVFVSSGFMVFAEYIVTADKIEYSANISVKDKIDDLYTTANNTLATKEQTISTLSGQVNSLQEELDSLEDDISTGTKEITANGQQTLDKYYKKVNVNVPLDIKSGLSGKTSFGQKGVSWSGFTVNHKYLALYSSVYFAYGTQAYLNSGAKDIEILASTSITKNSVWNLCSVITFTATSSTVSLYYEGSTDYYFMKFIDIT